MRSAVLKRNAVRAGHLKRWLESLDGVERVEVNPITGSALIYYRIGVVDGSALIARMRDLGWLGTSAETARSKPPARVAAKPRQGIERAVAAAILKCVAEAVIQRSVLALAAAVL